METAKFKRDKKLWKEYGPCDLHIVNYKNHYIIKGGNRSVHE